MALLSSSKHQRWPCISLAALKRVSSARTCHVSRTLLVRANELLHSDSSRSSTQLLSFPRTHRSGSLQKVKLSPHVRPARSYCSAAVEEDTYHLFSNVNVEVRGSDEAVLDSYCQFVSRAAVVLNFDISGKIILPTHFRKHTVLKSPHIYKKHMAQYEIRTYKRMLQLRHLTQESSSTFLEYIQRNLPEGVSMIVEQTELYPLPEYIKEKEAMA